MLLTNTEMRLKYYFTNSCILTLYIKSRVAQWKRAGSITQRSVDRGPPLPYILFYIFLLVLSKDTDSITNIVIKESKQFWGFQDDVLALQMYEFELSLV